MPDIAVWQQIKKTVEAWEKTTCSVDGCERKRTMRQYCGAHYARLKKAGMHPKDEPRVRASAPHVFFVNLIRLDTADECIDWPFDVRLGYAQMAYKHQTLRVSRLICEAENGEPPLGYAAAHECGNSKCVNPRHISWKTPKDNVLDKKRHGTQASGESHHRSKLTQQEVDEIRAEKTLTRRALSEAYGVSRATIDSIINRTTWRNAA